MTHKNENRDENQTKEFLNGENEKPVFILLFYV